MLSGRYIRNHLLVIFSFFLLSMYGITLKIGTQSTLRYFSTNLDLSSADSADIKVALKQKIRLSVAIANSTASHNMFQRYPGEYMFSCPFHQDKTPSLSVNDQLGIYHCFACGAKGDIFEYIRATYDIRYGSGGADKLSFRECMHRAINVAVCQDPALLSSTQQLAHKDNLKMNELHKEQPLRPSIRKSQTSRILMKAFMDALRQHPDKCFDLLAQPAYQTRRSLYASSQPTQQSSYRAHATKTAPTTAANSVTVSAVDEATSQRLKSINHCAAVFFESHLFRNTTESKRARSYLQSRGIQLSTVRRFRIGFAPHAMLDPIDLRISNNWKHTAAAAATGTAASTAQSGDAVAAAKELPTTDAVVDLPPCSAVDTDNLRQWLTANAFTFVGNPPEAAYRESGIRFNADDMYAAGLTLRSFSGRLIVPVLDESGDVLGFGTRLLPAVSVSEEKQKNKYVNTPTTAIYKKKTVLFGYRSAEPFARSLNALIIVEGYFDVLSMYEMGLRHVVAAMGTAVSIEQLRKAATASASGTVILMMDNDDAGRTACDRVVDKLKKAVASGQLQLSQGLAGSSSNAASTVKTTPFNLYAASMSSAARFIHAKKLLSKQEQQALGTSTVNHIQVQSAVKTGIKDCSDIHALFDQSSAKSILGYVFSRSKLLASGFWEHS